MLNDHLSQKSGASRASWPKTGAQGVPKRERSTGDLNDAMSVKSYASSRMSGASGLK